MSGGCATPEPAPHGAGDDRGEDGDHHEQNRHNGKRGYGMAQRKIAETDNEQVFPDAQNPVRERLRLGGAAATPMTTSLLNA